MKQKNGTLKLKVEYINYFVMKVIAYKTINDFSKCTTNNSFLECRYLILEKDVTKADKVCDSDTSLNR